MKKLLNQVVIALVAMLSVIILGLFIPMLVSLFVIACTETTLSDAVTCVPFWIFTILGWILGSFYVNDVLVGDE